MKKVALFLIFLLSLTFLVSCKNDVEDVLDNDEWYIKASENVPDYVNNYSVVNEFMSDTNNDGNEDIITLYIDAEQDDDGTFIKNDSNNWALSVFDEKNNKHYTLFNESVHVGDVYFQVADFFEKGSYESKILLYDISGSEIKILTYEFEDGKGFSLSTEYNSSEESDGGINLKFSTIPQL